ncbi:MAG: Lrp/AsnC ligand binding domain-containing protein [Zestosphaera sp.]
MWISMPVAIVLINTEIGSEADVLNALANIEGVKEIYEVYGMYDVVVKIEAPTHEALRDLIINKIRKIPQVRGTTTMIVVEQRIIS